MPTPPKGYQLDPATQDTSTVPDFIKKNVNVGSILQKVMPGSGTGTTAPRYETVAESNTPGTISVYDPKKYDVPTRNHEMDHQFQETRSDGAVQLPKGYELAPFGVTKSYAPEQYAAGDPRNYSYGGEAGLLAARNSGKTMADFNMEQQADIVADYKAKQDAYLAKVRAGTATPADLKAMYQTRQAYHPFVQQHASVPGRLRDMLPSMKTVLGVGTPPPLAPAPAAPGLPSYDTPGLGVAPADPLLGGQSVPVKSKGVARALGQSMGNHPTVFMAIPRAKGLRKPGNINIDDRPIVPNGKDTSTVWSTSFGTDAGEVLVPRVSDGEDGRPPHLMSESEALDYYRKYHKFLGIFDTPQDADAYAQALHLQQAKLKNINGRTATR